MARRGKKYARRPRRRRRRKGTSKMFKRKVQAIVNRNIETKHVHFSGCVDTTQGMGTLSAHAFHAPLGFYPQQGDSEHERIGNEIKVLSHREVFELRLDSSARPAWVNAAGTYQYSGGCRVRMIVYKKRDEAYANLIPGIGLGYDFFGLVNTDKYIVKSDRVKTLYVKSRSNSSGFFEDTVLHTQRPDITKMTYKRYHKNGGKKIMFLSDSSTIPTNEHLYVSIFLDTKPDVVMNICRRTTLYYKDA